METMKKPLVSLGFLLLLFNCVCGFPLSSVTDVDFPACHGHRGVAAAGVEPATVELTLIQGADSKGAVCLDGSLPGYHLHPGSGSGANNWIVHLEGGGWCNSVEACVYRKTTVRGSSNFMEKAIQFTGILSNIKEDNPDFYNWNRVKVRYCDGASFTGEGEDEAHQLYFRGQKIWSAVMDELLAKGLRNANQALLSGCSAGGLSSILHCDEFRALLPPSVKVKCLSDAGLFLDALDVSGGRTMRTLYHGVVTLQNVEKNLPPSCTNHLNATLCFFPENIIGNIKTPLFLINAAYDTWQLQYSLASPSADPEGKWRACGQNHANCTTEQLQFLQGFRGEMLNAVKGFSESAQNGLFINSCFAHCHSEMQETWFAQDSPVIQNKPIAVAVGDWFFERSSVKLIDYPYPYGKSCHHLVSES